MKKFMAVIGIILACFAASSSDAATIAAGTVLTVRTTSQISERDPVGRTFTAQIGQNVVVNGATVLRAGTQVTGRIRGYCDSAYLNFLIPRLIPAFAF